MPEPHGLDEVFSSIVSGIRPEAMVPERTESVSKAGARIMLEECLHSKLEVLAFQQQENILSLRNATTTFLSQIQTLAQETRMCLCRSWQVSLSQNQSSWP